MASQDELGRHYSTLGLLPGACLFEVKSSFRALSAASHPDNFPIGSPEYLTAQEKQKILNQAYEALKRYLQAAGDTGKPPERTESTAASTGFDADAIYARARSIEKGEGQPADVLKAMDLYKKLAAMGHPKAQFRLGLLYFDSVMKDVQQAHYWWKRAAENNHVGAQFNLGLLYERGYGVPKDDNEAFRWFKEAATRGDKQARQKLTAMGAITTPINANAPTAPQKSDKTAAAAEKIEAASGLAKIFLKGR
jgi:hypothetical protein